MNYAKVTQRHGAKVSLKLSAVERARNQGEKSSAVNAIIPFRFFPARDSRTIIPMPSWIISWERKDFYTSYNLHQQRKNHLKFLNFQTISCVVQCPVSFLKVY